MSKITTFPNMENEDNNTGSYRNTDIYTVTGELNRPEDLTACPSCGSQNLADSNFCIVCGSRLNRSLSGYSAFHASQVSLAEISSDKEPADMFKEGNPSAIKDKEPDKSKTALAADGGNGEGKPVPMLTRMKNGERTIIEKPMFKIGTSRESCDMVISDNRYISRVHAYIVTRNGRYFIVDRNSTNKTYVDGKAIPAETEAELFDSARVRLANEDMVFNIQYV